MGKKKRHHQLQEAKVPTKSVEQRWLERKQEKVVWGREGWIWTGILAITSLYLLLATFYIVTHWSSWGRSFYREGEDININNGRVQYIVMADDGSDIGSKIPNDSCYVDFGEKGGLILKDEWAERFTPGEAYNLFASNRNGAKIDRIISYEWRGGKT